MCFVNITTRAGLEAMLSSPEPRLFEVMALRGLTVDALAFVGTRRRFIKCLVLDRCRGDVVSALRHFAKSGVEEIRFIEAHVGQDDDDVLVSLVGALQNIPTLRRLCLTLDVIGSPTSYAGRPQKIYDMLSTLLHADSLATFLPRLRGISIGATNRNAHANCSAAPIASALKAAWRLRSVNIFNLHVDAGAVRDLAHLYCRGDARELRLSLCHVEHADMIWFLKRLPQMKCLNTLMLLRISQACPREHHVALEALADSENRIGHARLTQLNLHCENIQFYLDLNKDGFRHRLGSMTDDEWLRLLTKSKPRQRTPACASRIYYILRQDPMRWCRGQESYLTN